MRTPLCILYKKIAEKEKGEYTREKSKRSRCLYLWKNAYMPNAFPSSRISWRRKPTGKKTVSWRTHFILFSFLTKFFRRITLSIRRQNNIFGEDENNEKLNCSYFPSVTKDKSRIDRWLRKISWVFSICASYTLYIYLISW